MNEAPSMGPVLMKLLDDMVDSDTPLLPEIAVSDLLGVAWAGVEGPREEGINALCFTMADQLRPYRGKARPLLEILARQAPPEAATAIRQQAQSTLGVVPGWVPMLDTVELLDAALSADRAGAQENFILNFGYRDGDRVVGQHVIVVLVDHGLGMVKDAFLVNPAVDFAAIRKVFAQNRELIVRDLPDPRYVTDRLLPAMQATDEFPVVEMLGEELAQTWHLLKSRIPVMLAVQAVRPSGQQRSRTVTRFLGLKSTKATLEDFAIDRAEQRRLARAIVDYEADVVDGVWTPMAAEAFFMDFAVEQDWGGNKKALVELMIDYLIWRLKGTDYGPVTMAARRWGAEFAK